MVRFTSPGLAFLARSNHTNACFPSGCRRVFCNLTPGCATEILASLRFSPYKSTITGETKLVHQFGGSTLLICGRPVGSARLDSDRMMATRARMRDFRMIRGNRDWDMAVPRNSGMILEPYYCGNANQVDPKRRRSICKKGRASMQSRPRDSVRDDGFRG